MGQHRKPNGRSAGNDNREALAKIARLISVADEDSDATDAQASTPESDADDAREEAQALALLQEPGAALLLEALPAGLAVCDGAKAINFNNAFALAFGYSSAEKLKKAGGLEAVFPTALNTLTDRLAADAAGSMQPVELKARSRSGREFSVPVAVHPIGSGSKEHTNLLVLHPRKSAIAGLETSPEVAKPKPPAAKRKRAPAKKTAAGSARKPATKRKSRKKPVKAADKPVKAPDNAALSDQLKKADFLAKVSHELRTPLNSIIGFSELMKEEQLGPVGNDRYRGYIRDIHDSGLYALSLVNDLLDISKIEAGEFELNFAAVDINEVASEGVHSMQPQAQQQRVLLRTDFADDLPPVLADRRSIKQIILNLVSNAIKFTNSGGQVIVSTQKTGTQGVKIRVHDTGIGMSKEEIAVAMKPFQQPETAPRMQVGTGLGLPLTKALVEANRATFKLRSTSDTGTRIDVTFAPSRVAKKRSK